MKKNNFKEKILIFLVTIVVLINPLAVLGAVNNENETVIDTLTEVHYVNNLLEPYEINLNDVLSIYDEEDESTKEVYKIINEHLYNTYMESIDINEINNIIASETSNFDNNEPDKSESELYAKRIDYAHEIAAINKSRDRNAKNLESETVYMYLSHYIDVNLSNDLDVSTNSDDGYFSAWITNDDRKAYETFLSKSNIGIKMKQFMSEYDTYADLVYNMSDKNNVINALIEYEDTITELNNVISSQNLQEYINISLNKFISEYKEYAMPTILAWKNGVIIDGTDSIFSDPKKVIISIHELLEEKGLENKAMRDICIGAAVSMYGLMRPSIVHGTFFLDTFKTGSGIMEYILFETLNSTVLNIMTSSVLSNRDFFNYVNYIALRYTTSARIPNRMMRAWGW